MGLLLLPRLRPDKEEAATSDFQEPVKRDDCGAFFDVLNPALRRRPRRSSNKKAVGVAEEAAGDAEGSGFSVSFFWQVFGDRRRVFGLRGRLFGLRGRAFGLRGRVFGPGGRR